MKLKRKLLNTTMLRQPGRIINEIMRRGKRRGNLRQKEKGRSMVEMLGVLAIIGVLTIGGIAGYRLAMNKYRANQVAGEINIMKEELRIQMINGNQQITLGEPYNKEEAGKGELKSYAYEVSYGCGEGVNTYNNCQGTENYYIEVRGIEKRVCQPLRELLNYMPQKKTLKVNGKEEEGCEEEENVLQLVMNKEEGGRGNGSSDAGDNPSCPAGLTGADCSICENGNVYLSYMENPCEETEMNKKTCEVATDCENSYTADECCVDGHCVAGEYDPTTWNSFCEAKGECVSNGDCKEGEYCNVGGSNCEKPDIGTCTSIKGKRDMMVNGRRFESSTKQMSWWGAENWCRAQGMRLVSLSDVGCEAKEDQECTSETIRGLREEGLSGYFWTSSAESSCLAWCLFNGNNVHSMGRIVHYQALCVGS